MNSAFKTLAVAAFAAAIPFAAFAGESLLKSSDFSKEDGWTTWTHKPLVEKGGKAYFEKGEAVCSIPSVEQQVNSWMQIKKNIDLDSGSTYLVKFSVKSDKAGKISLNYQMTNKPWTGYARASVAIEAGEKAYEAKLNPKADKEGNYETPRMLNFCVGDIASSNLTLSNVSVELAD